MYEYVNSKVQCGRNVYETLKTFWNKIDKFPKPKEVSCIKDGSYVISFEEISELEDEYILDALQSFDHKKGLENGYYHISDNNLEDVYNTSGHWEFDSIHVVVDLITPEAEKVLALEEFMDLSMVIEETNVASI